MYAPKVLNGAIAALTDVWVCELAWQVLGERYVIATVSLFAYQKEKTISLTIRLLGVSIAHLILPWNILDQIDVELIGNFPNGRRFELLPMERPPAF